MVTCVWRKGQFLARCKGLSVGGVGIEGGWLGVRVTMGQGVGSNSIFLVKIV